jgi:D-3-phosphoglycerate dehydrogenase
MADGPFRSVRVRVDGEMAAADREVIGLALYKGLLTPSLGDRVNFVNCRVIFKERGVTVTDAHSDDAGEFQTVIQATLEAGTETHVVGGTVRRDGSFRLTEVDGYALDATPAGHLIVLKNPDLPGVVGRIGTILGDHQVNIAYLTWGRVEKQVGTALTVINIDSPLPEEGLATLCSDSAVSWARQIELPGATHPD